MCWQGSTVWAVECNFWAKLVPATRNNKVKFWKKYVLIGSYIGCKTYIWIDTSWTSLRRMLAKFEQMLHRFMLSASRCCYSRLGLIAIFWAVWLSPHPIFMSFGMLIQNLTSKNSNLKKKLTAWATWIC